MRFPARGSEAKVVYLFENYALDPERHELRRGGSLVDVEPQVFDVLAYLIRNRERVVTKEDLLAAVWAGRMVSDSTLSSRINAARVAIGDNGEDQRLVRTLSRKGFRFVGLVREEHTAPEPVSHPVSPVDQLPSPMTQFQNPRFHQELVSGTVAEREGDLSNRWSKRRRMSVTLGTGAGLGALAATLIFLFWPSPKTSSSPPVSAPLERFDASAVPLVGDEMRRSLANYPSRPDIKALAISVFGWGVADGEPDTESAKQEALRQCNARAKRRCRVYAVGTDVVWSAATLPLPAPADVRAEPLDLALVPSQIPTISRNAQRDIADRYVRARGYKALALTTGAAWFVRERSTRAEAVRIALEGCADRWQRRCLLLAVDDVLTLQIPKSRKIERIFLPSTEDEVPDPDKQRIVGIYQGHEWRALARGKGSWHPVAEAPSETAAIETALKACEKMDVNCRIYAVGNFRIAYEQ